MDYLVIQLLPYVLLAFAIGLVVGWYSVEEDTAKPQQRKSRQAR